MVRTIQGHGKIYGTKREFYGTKREFYGTNCLRYGMLWYEKPNSRRKLGLYAFPATFMETC